MLEQIQRLVARGLATNPAGQGLLLIGGFRYRLLDQSARQSLDIDYHWSGDLSQKQSEVLELSRRRLVPQFRRELGFDAVAEIPTGPEFESPTARFIEFRLWKQRGEHIVLPIEITRILHVDSTIVRTAEGVVYPTASDADLIEAKVLAVFNRLFLQHRDLVDIFLFGDRFTANSRERIRDKLQKLGVHPDFVRKKWADLVDHTEFHAKATQGIIDTQMEVQAAAQVNTGGGGYSVFTRARELLARNLLL